MPSNRALITESSIASEASSGSGTRSGGEAATAQPIRGRKVRGEALISVGFALLKAVVVFWIVSISERVFPAALLGVYLLSRRIASTVPNLTGLGVSNTLQRYLPLQRGGDAAAVAYMSVGLVVVLAANAALLGLTLVWAEPVSAWLFAEVGPAGDLVPLALWTIALCAMIALQFVVNGILMGSRRVLVGQLGDTFAIGGWQIVAFAYYGVAATPTDVVRFQAIAMLCTTPITLAYLIGGRWRASAGKVGDFLSTARRAFASYGLSRGVVTFLDSLLITVGPWMIRSRPAEMGYLLIALTLLRVVSTGLTPITKVVSVAMASLQGRGDSHAIHLGVNLMIGVVAVVSTFAAAALAPFAARLSSAWLHDPTTAAGVGQIVGPLLLALPASALFNAAKGMVDVHEDHPHNLVNLTASLFVVVVVSLAGRAFVAPVAASVWGIVIAHVVLAVLTLRSLRTALNAPSYFAPGRLLITAGVVVAVGSLIDRWIGAGGGWRALGASLGSAALLLLAGFAAYGGRRRPALVDDCFSFVVRGDVRAPRP